MLAATTYFADYVLEALFGSDKATIIPATMYLGLFTSEPNRAGTGTEVSGSGTNYSRVAVANNDTTWTGATSGVKSNAISITFPTASGDWGTVGWFGLWDATSGGNLLFYGALAYTISPVAGNTPFFQPNSLTLMA